MTLIIIKRIISDDDQTLGFISTGDWSAYTVEPPWKNNEPYISCIPPGKYHAFVRKDGKNGKCIELRDVPGRTHIQIHVANWAWQLQGCIGVGYDRWEYGVGRSKDAIDGLIEIIPDQKNILVEIIKAPHLPKRKGDEIEPAEKVPVKEIPSGTPEMPEEWKEPVNYKRVLDTFVGKLKRDIRRKEIRNVVFDTTLMLLSLRFPIVHQMNKLYQTITKKEDSTMKKKGLVDWFKNRIKEGSSWRGILLMIATLIIAIFGLEVSPEAIVASVESIVVAVSVLVASVVAFWDFITPEKKEDEND